MCLWGPRNLESLMCCQARKEKTKKMNNAVLQVSCLRAHEVRVVSYGNVFYVFVSVCILMAVLAPDCSLSGVKTARYCVCLFGCLHCIAHREGSTENISTHCLCCVCIVLHEWHRYRQQSDSRNRSRARPAGLVPVVLTGCLGCLCRLVDTALFSSSGGV